MSDSAPLEPAGDAPLPEAPPDVVEQVAPPVDTEPITDDATLAAEIEAAAVVIPDGERLIPESQLRNVAISYRNKLKAAKQGSPDAVRLQADLDRANQQLQAVTPLAQAFQAIQQAQQHQPQQQQQPPPEDTSELQEIAKDFDFYDRNGAPDLDRARRVQARTMKQAEHMAQQQVAPLVHQSISQQAALNIQRAKNTKVPGSNDGADPAILDAYISRIKSQPNGMATLADGEAMKHLWVSAYGATMAQRALSGGQQPAAVVAPPVVTQAPPVVTERSGGQAPSQARTLTTMEKRAAKEAGLTEKAYLDMASGMKW